MKVSYTGKPGQFPPDQEKKLKSRYDKVAKLLDRRGEQEAKVVIRQERHLNHVEFTVPFRDTSLLCEAESSDLFTALCEAVEKMEKQLLKTRSRRREMKRGKRKEPDWTPPEQPEVIETIGDAGDHTRSVYRVDHVNGRKPMTLDEALLEMEEGRNYMVYLDADTNKTTVVIRRPDGNFDMVES